MGLKILKYRHLAMFQKFCRYSKIVARRYSKNVADIKFMLLFLFKTWLIYRQSDECHLYSDFNGTAQVPRTVTIINCHHLKWGNMGYMLRGENTHTCSL